jgi:hypothetical protein
VSTSEIVPRTLGRWDLILLKIIALVNINNVLRSRFTAGPRSHFEAKLELAVAGPVAVGWILFRRTHQSRPPLAV